MRHIALKLGLMACTIAFATSANATPVTTWTVDVDTQFDTTSVVWDGSPAGTTNTSTLLKWGTSTGSGQSGIEITDSPSSTHVDTNGGAVPNVSITHTNQPITGTSLDSVNIKSILTLTPFVPPAPGLPSQEITFGVNFQETPNGDDPCAGGGANGFGVNVNGCADIFVIDQDALNFPFQYADPDDTSFIRTYFISFFELTSGLNPLPSVACTAAGATAPCIGFRTPETTNTTFQFAALITTEPVSVPEPGILALFGISLAGLGFARRRKSA